MRNPFLNWLFYGHVWIALAAAALSWQSIVLSGRESAGGTEVAFVFFATLGVYTLHRLLSYHRAGGQPDGRRYRLVARHAGLSLAVGSGSLLLALAAVASLPLARFWPVIFALPFTGFYLIPLYRGGPRLRDLPYLKVVWVALAWTLMTQVFPTPATGMLHPETAIRFAFTLAVALLFDTRDVVLDRRQGVRTLAADHPRLNRVLATLLLVGSAVASIAVYPSPVGAELGAAYALAGVVGAFTTSRHGEDWYAVAVNGLLLLPPLLLFCG